MASKKTAGVRSGISAKGLRFGIVAARFNGAVTKRLLTGALGAFRASGVATEDITTVWVPGAFEIPLMLQTLAATGRFDGLVALGAVIRGETPHFDYVADAAARGCLKVSLKKSIPVAFGVLTTHDAKQARERAGGRQGNKGRDAALTAIEMAHQLHRWRSWKK